MILRQMKDGSLADQVTITKEIFHAYLQRINSFVSKMASRANQQPQHPQQHPQQHQQERQQGGQAQQQMLQQPHQEAPHSKQAQAQLNAENLKIVDQLANHHRHLKVPPPP